MTHEMKLKQRYFDFMLNGTKRIEIRLYDEKRQKINIGDTIIFHNDDNLNQSFSAKVIGLLRYYNFADMLNDIDISLLADKSFTKEGLISVLEEFYTKEKQNEYGILGIRIKIL